VCFLNATCFFLQLFYIKPETFGKGQKIVDKAGTGLDYREIRRQFIKYKTLKYKVLYFYVNPWSLPRRGLQYINIFPVVTE